MTRAGVTRKGDEGGAMSELEKLEAGLEYNLEDAEVAARKAEGVAACARPAAADQSDAVGYEATARSILAEAGPGLDIQPGFRCDWSENIHAGDNFTANYNVTIFDIAPVTIGDGCMFGPGVTISAVTHPVNAIRRRGRIAQAKPVTIGNDVWLGANVLVIGVTIGDNVVVSAGTVVTRDIPSDSLAMGVPARVVRRFGSHNRKGHVIATKDGTDKGEGAHHD